DARTYNSWRNLILDVSVLAEPSIVDVDPWDTLRRVARICRGRSFANRLYYASSKVSSDTDPWHLDRELALVIDGGLSGQDRRSFRQGLGAMDALHDETLAKGAGVLTPRPVEGLPKFTDHSVEYPIPASLESFWNALAAADRNALSFVWRMGIMADIFTLCDTPNPNEFFAEGRGAAFFRLDPITFGLARPSRQTYSIYLHRLSHRISLMGGVALSKSVCDIESLWRELRELAQATPEISPARVGNLATLKTLAVRDGLSPANLDPEWVAVQIAGLPLQKRRALESACYTINDLCSTYGPEHQLLPARGTGIERQRNRGHAS
ncbi:hypothetical protein ACOI1H_22295, partial [Loktanella sp. DJP18]|uniref:hypothetical protein n=1 Tax=Loktanella sp. DJP18 TaxID=3409788 RepID=UPI003BB60003